MTIPEREGVAVLLWMRESHGDQRVCNLVLQRLVEARPDYLETVEGGSRAINEAASRLSCRWLWIHDPDVVLPFGRILDSVRSTPPGVALKPFLHYQALSQAESDSFHAGQQGQSGSGPRLGQVFGKASYLVDREVLLALGGLHPELNDLSEAGFDLARRVRAFFPEPQVLTEVEGLSLYRPRSPQEKNESTRARALRESLAGQPFQVADRASLQRLIREEAWRKTRPTPPPAFPQRLPGRLWGLTTFFNPHGYLSKKKNYQIFRQGLAQVGVPLCTVELAFENRPFELESGDAELLVQLRGADVLWQKERLLNLGLDRLPQQCDKVVWLDCDVLFADPEWAQKTADLLQQYVMVQPFSRSVRLLPGETACPTENLPLGSAEHEILHGIAWGVSARGHGCLGNYHQHGHTGYAWAGRRQVLQRHSLYDCNILGNADLNIAQAMFGGCLYLRTERLSPPACRHLMRWAEDFYGSVRGSVAATEGVLFHLWHGSKVDRLYDRRLTVLVDHDFDPLNDVRLDDSGAYCWSSDKPALHAWCRDYFADRREDGP